MRLGDVVETLVLNVVKNRVALCKGGVRIRLNKASLRTLMERIQTAGTEDPNVTPSPFPLEKPNLSTWELIFDGHDEPTPSAMDNTVEEATSKMDAILDGSQLAHKTVTNIVREYTKSDVDIRGAIEEAVKEDLCTDGHQIILSNYRAGKVYAYTHKR